MADIRASLGQMLFRGKKWEERRGASIVSLEGRFAGLRNSIVRISVERGLEEGWCAHPGEGKEVGSGRQEPHQSLARAARIKT